MRKTKKYFCVWLTVAITLLLATCTYDEWQSMESESPENVVFVEEAKAFFEEQMMLIWETGGNMELHGFATNFTPRWEGAEISGRDSMVSADVPIVTDFLFKVIIFENDTSKTEKFATDLLQKLIVVKDLRTGIIGSYVVSIIPDEAYAQSRSEMNAMDFTNYGDYGNFSGLVAYSFPLSPAPVRVNRYRDGILANAASFFGLENNSEEVHAVELKIRELMSGVLMKRSLRTGLRASGNSGNNCPACHSSNYSYNYEIGYMRCKTCGYINNHVALDGGELPEVMIISNTDDDYIFGNNFFTYDNWIPNYGDWIPYYGNWPPYSPDPSLGGIGGGGGNSGGGSSGGNGNSNGNGIVNKNNLDSYGKSELDRILEDLKEQCGYRAMYNYLTLQNYQISNISIRYCVRRI